MDSDEVETADAGTAETTDESGERDRSANRRITGDRYQLGEAIGRGGMGEVIAARDQQIGREVAIKLMQSRAPSERAIARFVREAQIQGRLDHPAIVPVHELGRDLDGRPFFAMKKLAGTTLAALLDAPRPRLLRAFVDVCLAVEFAHTRGFIHRDLKPDNIMLGDFGEVYVLDWGVAKVIGEPDGPPIEDVSGELATAAGVAIGTAGYMAPEQARGVPDLDARADVYSLGCVLFELLSGERLLPKGAGGLATAIAGIDGRPSLRAPDREIPPELDALCDRATARDRKDRIATARELGDSVQHYLDGDRDLARRKTLAQEHLDTATAAFAAGDREDTRRTAMREAGRALALDPTLHGAAELLGRLMLEPPPVAPAEVRVAIAEDNSRAVQRTMRTGSYVLLAYFLFVPMLIWIHPRSYWEGIAMFVMVGISALFARLLARPGSMSTVPILVSCFLTLVLMARMFTPYLLPPGVAAVTAHGLLSGPKVGRRHSAMIMAVMCAGVLLPWLAEVTGVLSPTAAFTPQGMLLTTPYTTGDALPLYVTYVAFVITLVGASVVMAATSRRAERTARDYLYLQAWHLRQLVGVIS
jgi:eukaryotic-like serine/threonine-protein kinase